MGSVIGIIPTRDAAVQVTIKKLRDLHQNIFTLVDGDKAGDGYVKDLISCNPSPAGTIQWPSNWCIEDVIGWIIEPDATVILPEIAGRLDRHFSDLSELVDALKNPDGKTRGLKSHYVAHEEIASVIKSSEPCVQRAEVILEALTRATFGLHEGFTHLDLDKSRSSKSITIYRFHP